jgi:hypothetical protein
MNQHVHPLFREILNGVALQPTLLHRAETKQAPRRFAAEPETPSAFTPFAPTPEERAQWAREDHEDALYDESKLDDYRERERAADEEAMRYWPEGDR